MAFAEYYNADKGRVTAMMDEISGSLYKKAAEMFDRHFMGDSSRKDTFSIKNEIRQKLQLIVDYTSDHDLAWNVVERQGKYLYLCFSGNYMFWTTDFCELIELPDYDAMSMSEIRGLIGEDAVGSFLPAEMGTLSINRVNEEKDALSEKKKQMERLKDDINYARTEGLKEINDQIQKLKDELYEKKQAMLAELREKEAALLAQVEQMNKQIYMMESEIYAIRSYSGETVELRRIRNGKKADKEAPLIINQKLMYLDEDLARIISIYQNEISHQFSLFSEAVAGCEEVFESFCPQERCLTFFRLSRNASYRWYNGKTHMYETEDLIHGKKMGFLLRDGENAYIGWLDESWRVDKGGEPVPVTFTENLLYKPGETEERELADDESLSDSDSTNTMLSRAFAMSVVQGILDNRGLLNFPEKVSVTRPGLYIRFNYATGWIMDDRFGDFATLVDNLNKRTRVKDQILVCYNKTYSLVGRGEADRVHDCEVPEGLNQVNFLEADEYGHCNIYVSAEKAYSACGATANVLCRDNEYINITYMNSIWLKYYVQTKKLGKYAEDYAKMVKHFKRAIEVITEREAEEMAYIKKYYPDADQIPEWQVLLSHWKLNHHIRFINDFQAKRIAKYLEAGNYEENAHLFEKEELYNVDSTAGGTYQRTQFGWVRKGWVEKPDPEGFGRESAYYYDNFYLNDYDTNVKYSNDAIKEQAEKNAVVIAKDLPKLEARVPERMKKDEEKLTLVANHVMEFLAAHGVRVSDLTEESRETVLILDNAANKITFKLADDLNKEERQSFFVKAEGRYEPYIIQSECWKLAYYDHVQRCYDKVLHDAKMIIHKRFMNDTKGVRNE